MDEEPARWVHLDGYWIDSTEVTNEQYAAFLNARGNQSEGGVSWVNAEDTDVYLRQVNGRWETQSGYERHPVVEVSWYGAAAYCKWVGGRLPTEAEWEKAARGTDGRRYPWGDGAPNCELVNYGGCRGNTMVVGSYPGGTSPYGAYDMAGNVWEWVADWYDEGYYKNSPERNPMGPASGDTRVARGGSWTNYIKAYLRTSVRFRYSPSDTHSYLGFRCVLDTSS